MKEAMSRSRKKTEKLIKKYFDWWATELGLRQYRFNRYFCTTKEWSRDDSCAAYVVSDWRYQQASIYFNIEQARMMYNDEVEEVVVHELCHVLINEIQDDEHMDHVERVTTQLARAYIWVRNQAKKDAQ